MKQPLVQVMIDKLHDCIRSGKYQVVERDKNLRFMAENGLTPMDQEEILLGLTYTDFIKSENDRDDFTGKDIYWFFKPYYDDKRLYVKYKVWFNEEDGDYALVKSLHEDEV